MGLRPETTPDYSRLRTLLRYIRLLYPRGRPLPDDVRNAFLYLFHNRWRMRYYLFREAGYPIGSGTVESACKMGASPNGGELPAASVQLHRLRARRPRSQ